mmetsp:Transcript_25860/g.36805  ORF Transcript_25860/g.36805 Transcript_25860/m.36805 type:complete len:299 (+) Transcript_25860:1255-2151(+)
MYYWNDQKYVEIKEFPTFKVGKGDDDADRDQPENSVAPDDDDADTDGNVDGANKENTGNENDKEEDDDNMFPALVTQQLENQTQKEDLVTRSGRVVKSCDRLIEDDEFGAFCEELNIDDVERRYFEAPVELGLTMFQRDTVIEIAGDKYMLIGAGIGNGFESTDELRVMKYDEAMSKDPIEWGKSVKEEYDRFVNHKAIRFVKRSEVPDGAKILTSTWAMKQKANVTKRARLNGRGFEQIDGEHYNKDSVASPTVNVITVRVVFVIMLLMCGIGHLINVNGAFLLGGFERDLVTKQKR